MQVVLPQTSRDDTLLRWTAIVIFNWVAWFLPAFFDATANDVGSNYQMGVTALVVFTTVLALFLPFMLFFAELLPGFQCLAIGIFAYLLFGALYHLHERSWGM